MSYCYVTLTNFRNLHDYIINIIVITYTLGFIFYSMSTLSTPSRVVFHAQSWAFEEFRCGGFSLLYLGGRKK
jgi:hypothetical protein